MEKRPSQKPGKAAPTLKQPTEQDEREIPGILGVMARNPKLLGFLNLMAAILLLYFTFTGFMDGLVFLPFGFGLMGLYFFYSYVRNSLRVDFGKLTVPFNLVLLIGSLVCLVIGVTGPALR